MGKTVIEELVISLGLDAKKLEDSKAVEAINSIRQAVKGLDEELKGVEKSIRAVGAVKFGGGGSRKAKVQAPVKTPTAADFAQDFALALLMPKKKEAKTATPATETQKEVRERRRRPIKSMGDILNLMPGFASVVYMAKEIFSLASKIMGMFGVVNEQARDLKNASQRSGISTNMLQTIGLMSQKFGGKKEETISEIENLITKIPVFGGGPRPEIFDKLRIETYTKQGKIRPSDDILKDVMEATQSWTGGDLKRGAQFGNEVGMSASAINTLAQGRDAYFKAELDYIKNGMIITDDIQKTLNEIALKNVETKSKIEKSKAEISASNVGIQKAWNDIEVGLFKTVETMSKNKVSTLLPSLMGPLIGLGAFSMAGFKIGQELYNTWNTPNDTSVKVPSPSGVSAAGATPTNAVINIYGTPTNSSKVDIKWNKPGPYRENLVRVQ